jgi:Ni,Fe-hydrogenase III large subunit
VLDLEIQLGYTYKGTEALWVGQRPEEGLLWAESISGDHSVAGAVAYAQAVEAAQGLPVPAAAEAARGLLLEVERYAFHLGTVAGIALDVGYARGAAAGYRLRQRAHRCLDRLTGSRLGRGAIAVGGLRRPLMRGPAAVLVEELQSMSNGAVQIWEDLEAVASVVDRIRGTGEVSPAIARALQLVGPTGRASGIDHDVRRDRPYGIYRSLAVRVPTEARGDVEARLRLYALEAAEAGRLAARWVESALAAPGVGRIAPEPQGERAAHGLGVVESPRGEWLVRMVQDARGRLVRVHVREPSFLNWRALKYAARCAIVPDFPLCNKSFNLSYSGFDR